MLKKTLLATMVATSLGLGAVAVAPIAQAADIVVRVAPPAPRHEVQPPPRRGYIWVPGHWDWRHGRYAWTSGSFVRERPGYRYDPPQWVEDHGSWRMRAGHWGRGDRDHDGIPNRVDRDRDNDGVPNRVDRAPNNPHRD